ncbi:putative short-chain type dehydrogenase-reductase VdlC protein [Marine Group I thaumarchaeote SCGC AAA799-E16]|uniref:3-oxoacyl-acyl-carrier-protein reductase FabG n=4 Tax=Marine Group I TaxID=905826 RepID=A0A087S0J2_9ARCH|nr:putative short-chain type dehydrogenase-reductase VdlC protein [Marine Group I thaumarchaeote SCGC AAA799-N04]KER06181.1 putative short-chain type dehydrogenase-reductase VdlC protein [Marine Group I thaumarchaeote SCGC AAA799-E16]KFM15519.1 putative short-chain type dehydrogenase-reductase VdlC protein [Marine Group I thaumarchaeote SCGC AAA799-D11]KFM19246.1 3-oxoacyl-acyl-carrier-protein reductase FabG [Marine Group I thaumarchaeote SCGC RSA3]
MEKVALVTGSSSGIGLEAALALAKDGYHTFASMRDLSKADELENAAKKDNLPIEVIELDVDKEDSIVSAIKKVIDSAGRLDVLVNNAGYGQFGCTEDVTVDDFRKQFETNFFSIVRIIQEVAPIMRNQNSGSIINISSVAGRMGLPGSPAYISSKFALEGLGECLRYELGQFGIKTTLIEPGVIKTNFFESMKIPDSKTDPKYKELTDHILAGLKMMVQMGTAPSQVAEVIIKAIHDEEMLPRYVVGTDAAMFMEAKKMKTDLEFEKYMSKELFPG